MADTDAQGHELLGLFADAATACGEPEFHETLLIAIGKIVTWDTCGLIQFSRHAIPQYVLKQNVPPEEMEFYLSGFYRLDPFFKFWRTAETDGVFSLGRIAKTPGNRPVDTSSYQTLFQPRTGMLDEIGIFCGKFSGVADDFFLLRRAPYCEAELTELDRAFPLISALHRLNTKITLRNLRSGVPASKLAAGADVYSVLDRDGNTVFSSDGWQETVSRDLSLSDAVTVLSQGDEPDVTYTPSGFASSLRLDEDFALAPGGKVILVVLREQARPSLSLEDVIDNLYSQHLTPRETAICQLILQGHPTAGIAERLGISIGTVKNHRKRIYRKLDITTERELFLAVLSWLSRTEH